MSGSPTLLHGAPDALDRLRRLLGSGLEEVDDELSFHLATRVRDSQAAGVPPEFFATLGVAPRLGRPFTAEEDVPDGPGVVVISERLWRSAFAADPRVVGRRVEVDGVSSEIIG